MTQAPRDRAYDPQRRPNIYYRDPESMSALADRAIEATNEARWDRPNIDRNNEAWDIVHGSAPTFNPMTVDEAYRRAEAGNPISPDATSMAAVAYDDGEESLDDKLNEASGAKDDTRMAREEAARAREAASSAEEDARSSEQAEAEKKANLLSHVDGRSSRRD